MFEFILMGWMLNFLVPIVGSIIWLFVCLVRLGKEFPVDVYYVYNNIEWLESYVSKKDTWLRYLIPYWGAFVNTLGFFWTITKTPREYVDAFHTSPAVWLQLFKPEGDK